MTLLGLDIQLTFFPNCAIIEARRITEKGGLPWSFQPPKLLLSVRSS